MRERERKKKREIEVDNRGLVPKKCARWTQKTKKKVRTREALVFSGGKWIKVFASAAAAAPPLINFTRCVCSI